LGFFAQVCRTRLAVGAKEAGDKAGGKVAAIWVIRNPASYNRLGDIPPIGGGVAGKVARPIGELLQYSVSETYLRNCASSLCRFGLLRMRIVGLVEPRISDL